jgi:hypothetical protein
MISIRDSETECGYYFHMKKAKIVFLFVFILLMSAVSIGQKPVPREQWKTFKSKLGGFSVSFPGDATESMQRTDNASTYSAECDAGATSYFASFSVFNKPVVDREKAEAILEGAQSGIVNSVKAKIATQQSLLIQGMPARRIRFTFVSEGNDGAGESIIVFTGDHLYQFMVLTGTPGPNQDDVAVFVSSISLESPKYYSASAETK